MKNLRPEVEKCLKSSNPGMHGVTDLLDDLFLAFYNITDEEFDYMLEHVSDEENHLIVDALGTEDGPAPFSVRRQALILRNLYVERFGTLK